ncbi:hypothetical protein VNO78_10431 [Psophocarpus tetragonolobus]|uniref:Uncharacterized protein n=1 Tax=Psophocarpus tetragonolobus TaxID=3891 RepID=A0AAN9SK26_PSOTE
MDTTTLGSSFDITSHEYVYVRDYLKLSLPKPQGVDISTLFSFGLVRCVQCCALQVNRYGFPNFTRSLLKYDVSSNPANENNDECSHDASEELNNQVLVDRILCSKSHSEKRV